MISPKSRLFSIWLCGLFGFFGAHRFYLKKHSSGFLMLLSFGGLGFWLIADYFLLTLGLFKDGDGLYVKKWSNSYIAPKIILSLIIIAVPPVLLIKNADKIKWDKSKLNLKLSELYSKPKTILPKKADTSNELIKYVDNKGTSYFVNDINKIPIEYRNKIETNLKLPELSRVDIPENETP